MLELTHRSQGEHDDEKAGHNREEAGRQWQIHMAHPHWRCSISLEPGYHRANFEPAKGRFAATSRVAGSSVERLGSLRGHALMPAFDPGADIESRLR
jgi:hypothetical protein